ncbi:MAG: hypothetical protein MJE68_09430 [Proteobacteria bacterium]|nr:hypothetical protein [Pseudomonadota bacterium]
MTEAYSKLKELGSGDKVTLGDGSTLDITGEETVDMDMFLNDGIRRKCTLNKVLYVTELGYSLISVARAGYAEKTVHFDDSNCEFRNKDEIITVGACEGSPYHLRYAKKSQEGVSAAENENKEDTGTAAFDI